MSNSGPLSRITLLICVLFVASPCVSADHGYKRGVVGVGVSCADLEQLAPGVSWFYQYGQSPDRDIAACAARLGLEFVAMQKGEPSVGNLADSLPRNTKNLLGFNEPSSPKQANLSPEEAAQVWMNQVIPQLRRANYKGRIGSPSPSLGRVPGPLPWLERFFAACEGCHFDYVTTHYYGDSVYNLQVLVQGLNKRFELPIWVTEFAYPHGRPAIEKRFMENAVAWMEKTQYIERYAWFAARNQAGGFTGVETSLLQPGKPVLTLVGQYYISLPFQVPDSSTAASSTNTISLTTSTTAGIVSSTSISTRTTSTKTQATTASAKASSTRITASASKQSQSASTNSAKSSTSAAKLSSTVSKASSTSTNKASTLGRG